MLRKFTIALAGLCALSLSVWTLDDASARGGHGGSHGGGSHGSRAGFTGKVGGGSSFRGRAGGSSFRSGLASPRFSASRISSHSRFYRRHHHRRVVVRVGAPLYAYYNSCYRWRRVWTPYGPQLRRVYVCGYRHARIYPYWW